MLDDQIVFLNIQHGVHLRNTDYDDKGFTFNLIYSNNYYITFQ